MAFFIDCYTLENALEIYDAIWICSTNMNKPVIWGPDGHKVMNINL
jgi:hypothetical protein